MESRLLNFTSWARALCSKRWRIAASCVAFSPLVTEAQREVRSRQVARFSDQSPDELIRRGTKVSPSIWMARGWFVASTSPALSKLPSPARQSIS